MNISVPLINPGSGVTLVQPFLKDLLLYYNDNLMVLSKSLAAIGSGTRGFQKAQMGSNES